MRCRCELCAVCAVQLCLWFYILYHSDVIGKHAEKTHELINTFSHRLLLRLRAISLFGPVCVYACDSEKEVKNSITTLSSAWPEATELLAFSYRQ